MELFVKGLLDEAKQAFNVLQQHQKIDPCLSKLLHTPKQGEYVPEKIMAFEVTNTDILPYAESIPALLSNKLFMYLVIQSIRRNGVFGLPFPAWSKTDIEKEQYFKDLKNFFKKVFVIGSGKAWVSSHLVVSEPFGEIVNFMKIT